MKIEKFEDKENKSLERKEVTAYITFDGATPKRDEIKKEMCTKVGANPEMSIIRKIQTTYGRSALKAWLHVYNNAEKMKQVESKYLLIRDGLIKEKKEEEKPAEKKEPKKDEPKKEAKEEKPAEKKGE